MKSAPPPFFSAFTLHDKVHGAVKSLIGEVDGRTDDTATLVKSRFR